MDIEKFKNFIQDIVKKADALKHKLIHDLSPVNYACIFCQNDSEYMSFLGLAKQMGTVVQETKAGPVFRIMPLTTVAGDLQLLKIRKPDPTRPERGDADFTLADYDAFKRKYVGQKGFNVIDKGNFEMVEYKAPNADVLVYFSHPTLAKVLGIE